MISAPMAIDLHLEHFLADLKGSGRHAGSTLRAYHGDLKQFGHWLEQFRPDLHDLKELTRDIIDDYLKHIFHKQELGRTTVGRRYQAVRRLCEWALATRRCENNFCQLVTSPVVERRHEAPSALTAAQIQALLRAAGSSSHGFGPRNYALLQLLLETGLRVSEVVALKNQDVSISDRTGFLWAGGGAGHEPRKVMLPNKSRWALRRYQEEQGPCPADRPVFLNQEGAALTPRGVQHLIADVVRRAGLENDDINAQRLRYTFGVNYLKKHPDQRKEWGRVLGLHSPVSLRIYACDGEDRRRRKKRVHP